MLAPMPKKAFITVAEVAGAVEYLMSDVARTSPGDHHDRRRLDGALIAVGAERHRR